MRTIIDSHGPQAVGIFFGSGIGMDAAGYRMAEALQTAIATPAKFSPLTIDGTAKPLVADLMGGFMGLSCRADYDGVDFLIYVGSNPVVSHGHALAMPNATGTIREIARRGQVWVIDPRHTETARLATGHLAPRPGTDYAVLAYLVRELLVAGADRDIMEHRAVDAERLAAAVEPFTCAHTAALADVDPAALIRLRDAVRGAGRLAVETGTGVTMARSANVTQWLAWALMILTDSMNRPGGAWFHPGYAYQLESFPALPISPPEGTFGPGPRSRPEARSFLGEWPCAALADEIDAGNIRALVNLGGGLLTAFPNAAALRSALDRLDVLATLEILPTEITAVSTHVLPAKDQLERADVTLWDILSTNVSAQYTPPSSPRPVSAVRRGGCWPSWAGGSDTTCATGASGGHRGEVAPDADDAMLARVMGRARGEFADLVAAGYQEAPRELPAAWRRHTWTASVAGGWPRRHWSTNWPR